jgi:hypothetical protein
VGLSGGSCEALKSVKVLLLVIACSTVAYRQDAAKQLRLEHHHSRACFHDLFSGKTPTWLLLMLAQTIFR